MGETEEYDGSGYIVDIPINQTMQEFQGFFTDLMRKENGYLDPSTRVMFVSFSLYQP